MASETLPLSLAVGVAIVLALAGCGNSPTPHANGCVTFPSHWVDSRGEYIFLAQDGCDIRATNPVQRWSPTIANVKGREIRTNVNWTTAGTLSADNHSITWNDKDSTVWSLMKAGPKEEGLKEVRDMLQYAIEIEHHVIQPYLSALYSIHPDSNAKATSILHDIVVEEMLHMTSASNVLNAIGGHPVMNTQSFAPKYPVMLPFVNVSLGLAPFTPDQMDIFRRVEEPTWGPDNDLRINTAGVYYFRIGMKLETLVQAYGMESVYIGNHSLQVDVSSSRGDQPGIYNHKDAWKALTGIYGQGEGFHGSLYETSAYNGQEEISHYYRFNELTKDRCYVQSDNGTHVEDPTGSSLNINWTAVYKFKPNPRTSDFVKYPDIHKQMVQFNSCYTAILAGLHDVFNGNPGGFAQQIGNMITIGQMAKNLMAIPHPEHDGLTVGPSWEWTSEASECPGQVSEYTGQLGTDQVVV